MWYVCAKVLFILYLLISAIKREPDLSEAGTGHCGYTCTTNYNILGLVFGRWELLLEGLLNLGYAWQDITYIMLCSYCSFFCNQHILTQYLKLKIHIMTTSSSRNDTTNIVISMSLLTSELLDVTMK